MCVASDTDDNGIYRETPSKWKGEYHMENNGTQNQQAGQNQQAQGQAANQNGNQAHLNDRAKMVYRSTQRLKIRITREEKRS